MVNLKARLTQNVRNGATGVALTVVCGLGLWLFPVGDGFVRVSYDVPFAFGTVETPSELIIIQMDEQSHQELNQGWDKMWDRGLHARLLRQLKADQCKLVVFDVFLADPGLVSADADLAEAIKSHGNVVLAADRAPIGVPGQRGERTIRPRLQFLEATTNWGISKVQLDADLAIRKHYPGTDTDPSLAWAAATVAGAAVAKDPSARVTERWVRYYGPYATIPGISYYRALEQTNGFFRDKIVFIGGKPRTRFVGEEIDDFRTPYTRWDSQLSSGAEIEATMFLNLLRGYWLTRLSAWNEFLLLLLTGLLFGYGLTLVRPTAGAGLGILGFLGVGLVALISVWQWHIWFSWLVLAGAQIPCAWAWSVLAYARGLSRRNVSLEKQLETARASSQLGRPPRGAMSPHGTRAIPAIPGHTLLHCIGKGAFGEVWLARNAVGLYHAVKIVYREEFKSADPYEREFKGIRKFMPVSLDHPGLLRILHVDRNDEAEYFHYIMEIGDDEVSGQKINPDAYSAKNLAKEIHRRGQIPIKECLPLFLSLTEALQFLHQQRLIHRDIKPANIIYVNDRPKFADIGLVTDVGSSGRETTNVGTEGYIAPEGPGAPVADVYSLGKVIYVASMGKSPHDFPVLPTTLVERADSVEVFQLNKIIVKACEYEPRKRYASAAELRDALLELQHKLVAYPKA